MKLCCALQVEVMFWKLQVALPAGVHQLWQKLECCLYSAFILCYYCVYCANNCSAQVNHIPPARPDGLHSAFRRLTDSCNSLNVLYNCF